MSVTLLRQPPADLSEGIMVVRYRNGFRAIFQRLHVNTTDPTTLVTAFEAYAAIVKNFYDSAWTIDFTSLYHVVAEPPSLIYPSGARVPQRFAAPVAATVTGVGATATSGISAVTRRIYTFKTEVQGHSAAVKFEGIGGCVPTEDYEVTSAAGGTTHEQDLVAALVNVAGVFVAHDGTRLQEPTHVTTPLAKRDRAKSMRVA